MKVAATVLLTATLLGVGGAHMIQEPAPPVVITQAQQTATSALENARRSVVKIILPAHFSSGSATLIARKTLKNGQYRYRALTAMHVVQRMMTAFQKDKSKASHAMKVVLQPSFHGGPLKVDVNIEDIDWASSSEDWASFTFVMSHKASCAPVATKAEFEAIESFEKIYAVGCPGYHGGQLCRQGLLGATHNEEWDLLKQYTERNNRDWNRAPHKFLRASIGMWYGDSGGAIFNKDGKLIGVINGFTILGNFHPVTNSTVAIKAHLIREVAQNNKDFFLVEK